MENNMCCSVHAYQYQLCMSTVQPHKKSKNLYSKKTTKKTHTHTQKQNKHTHTSTANAQATHIQRICYLTLNTQSTVDYLRARHWKMKGNIFFLFTFISNHVVVLFLCCCLFGWLFFGLFVVVVLGGNEEKTTAPEQTLRRQALQKWTNLVSPLNDLKRDKTAILVCLPMLLS